MKCRIKSIRPVFFDEHRTGCRVEGILTNPMIAFIPPKIWKWIGEYKGVKISLLGNHFLVSAWGDAVCAEEDTYDSKKGAHIAESRAKAKIYRFARTYARFMSDHLGELAEKFDDINADYMVRADQEEDHICDLANEE